MYLNLIVCPFSAGIVAPAEIGEKTQLADIPLAAKTLTAPICLLAGTLIGRIIADVKEKGFQILRSNPVSIYNIINGRIKMGERQNGDI